MTDNIDVDKIKGTIEDAIQKGIIKSTNLVHSKAMQYCPVDTGRMKNAILQDVKGLEGSVSVNVNYAEAVEYGTGAHKTSEGHEKFVENIKEWCRLHGIENWYAVYKKIVEEGTPMQPFLRPALYDNIDKAVAEISNEISKVLK
jgi:HK97 gp10 family phage protein